MLKKIAALFLTLTLFCSLAAIDASANNLASFISPTVDQRTEGSCVIVSGEIDTDVANTTIVFRLIETKQISNPENPEENIEVEIDGVVDFTTSYRDGDTVRFDFDTIYLPADLESGDYTVEISGMNIRKYVSVFPYVVPSEMISLLESIRFASETEEAKVGPIIAQGLNAKKLALDVEGYTSLGQDGDALDAFETIMKSVTYIAPSGVEDGVGIDREKAKIAEAYTPAVAAGKLMLIAEESAVSWNSWYDSYYKLLGFDDETDKPEAKRVTPYLEAVKSSSDFTERIYKADENLNPKEITIDKIRKYLYQSTLLSTIYSAKSDSKVLDILQIFSDEYFSADDWKLNWNGYGDLGVNKGSVISDMRGQNFSSCKAAVDKFNELVQNYGRPSGSGSSGNGNTGSANTGSANSSKPSQVVMPPQTTQQNTEIFSDINSIEWAKDAIEQLYAKGIINGNPDGTFTPNKNVTRAEFIKMVVEAMGVGDVTVDVPFADVEADKWYASYVAKAYKEGIVLGDGSGKFYPNNPVTRQDMVAILYRANGSNEKAAVSFADSHLISEYARDAVGYFASKGIVTGYEDGRFAPQDYATRAQTAVILYRLINN